MSDSSRIRRAFAEAYSQALISREARTASSNNTSQSKFFHGAVVLQGNRIIGSGYNTYTRNYVQGKFYLSIHAELAAMLYSAIPFIYERGSHRKNNHKNFRKKVIKNPRSTEYDLLVIRINPDGQLKNSRPCILCIEDMKRRNIKRVFYTNDQGKIVYENIHEMIPKPDLRPSFIQKHIQ